MSRKLKFGFRYGTKKACDTAEFVHGRFNIAVDTGQMSVDIEKFGRIQLGDILVFDTEAEILALENPTPKLHFAKDTKYLYYYDTDRLVWITVWADTSSKAVNDEEGNNIVKTYATKAEAETITNNLQSLVNTVGNINRFNVIVLDNGEALPDVGEEFTIYFVPSSVPDPDTDQLEATKNVYDEFIYIYDTARIYAHYEQIGVTNLDLTQYYTKIESDNTTSQIYASIDRTNMQLADDKADSDEKIQNNADDIAALRVTVTDNENDIEAKVANLNSTVSDNKSSEAATVTTLEKKVDDNEADIEAKHAALTNTVNNNKTNTDEAISTLDTKVNTNKANTDDTIKKLEKKVDDNETDIEAKHASLTNTVNDNEADIEKKFNDLTATVNQNETDIETKHAALVKTVNDNENDIETKLSTHQTNADLTYAKKIEALTSVTIVNESQLRYRTVSGTDTTANISLDGGDEG